MILTYNRKRSCHHSVPSIAKLRSSSVQQIQMRFMEVLWEGELAPLRPLKHMYLLRVCMCVCTRPHARFYMLIGAILLVSCTLHRGSEETLSSTRLQRIYWHLAQKTAYISFIQRQEGN